MDSLIAAYVGGWLAVSAYVGWLGVENARAARRLDELKGLLKSPQKDADRSKAA
jgi:hypothetical protein